jgi:hypothetical protein
MNDPDVVSLTYRIKTSSDLKFDNPLPFKHDNDVFKMTLADGFVGKRVRSFPCDAIAFGSSGSRDQLVSLKRENDPSQLGAALHR